MDINTPKRVISSLAYIYVAYKVVYLLYWYLLRRRTNLLKVYGKGTWCVVTGSSSGIGAEFAYKLGAEYGYKLILVARREEQLIELSNKIKNKNKDAVVKILPYDLSSLGTEKEEFGNKFASAIESIVKDEGLSILVHMAGNSDLAYHLTDKSTKRNQEVLNIAVSSTLIVVQSLLPLLIRKRLRDPQYRAAVLTPGALTAIIPAPTFACSSANKNYVRAFTLAAGMEYGKEGVDFLVAHPIGVKSEILKHTIPGCITSEVFVDGVLGDVGQTFESTGYWLHDLIVYLLSILPYTGVREGHYAFAPAFSELLERPIDTRKLIVKLGFQ